MTAAHMKNEGAIVAHGGGERADFVVMFSPPLVMCPFLDIPP